MAEISPFHIVRYNGSCAGELDRIVTPPYDVISSKQQEEFYAAHPYNMIRLVLGRQYPEDGPDNNRYTRAAQTLSEWLHAGALVRLAKPGLTIYQLEFDCPDGRHQVLDGIVALVKVDDYGKGRVLPHEKTYKGPKQDQLNLLRACKAHFTPIHALFNDPTNTVLGHYRRFMEQPPQQQATDRGGIIHRTWEFDDPEIIERIAETISPESIFIADGHHRYETSMAYRSEVEAAHAMTNGTGHRYVMMYLTSMAHPGLTILPAHRMIRGLASFDVKAILERLSPLFSIEEIPFTEENRMQAAADLTNRVDAYSSQGGAFGMVTRNESCYRLLRVKDPDGIDRVLDPAIPHALRTLDVTIMGEVIKGYALCLDPHNCEGMIEYTPSAEDAVNRTHAGEFQASFILNPTRVDQVQKAAELGHKLPHKSTYFFPKLASGLVLNVFS